MSQEEIKTSLMTKAMIPYDSWLALQSTGLSEGKALQLINTWCGEMEGYAFFSALGIRANGLANGRKL
jgi:hypothetical protein